MAEFFEMYYGEPGSGKSKAAARIAAKIYNETGKIARIAIGDGSAKTYQGLVDAKAAEVIDFSIRDFPLTTIKRLTEGWWPLTDDLGDPLAPLMPPIPSISDDIGITIFEGASMAGLYILGDRKGGLAERSGRGEKIGQDSAIQICDDLGPGINNGKHYYGGNPLAHFNVAQRKMVTYIDASRALPGWVIWTAHEKSGEDNISQEKIVGPEVAGKALSSSLARQYHNTLHFVLATKVGNKTKDDVTGKAVGNVDYEYRIYTRDHYDPDGLVFVKFRAVNRCDVPSMMPNFLTGKEVGDNILNFYSLMAEAQEKNKNAWITRK